MLLLGSVGLVKIAIDITSFNSELH